MEDSKKTILNCDNLSQSHITIRAIEQDDDLNTSSQKKSSRKFKQKKWVKFIFKWAYLCSLGLIINFFKSRFLSGYYALISFNLMAILISALELGIYLLLAGLLAKDAIGLFSSFF